MHLLIVYFGFPRRVNARSWRETDKSQKLERNSANAGTDDCEVVYCIFHASMKGKKNEIEQWKNLIYSVPTENRTRYIN
jgi:hypothetical protein